MKIKFLIPFLIFGTISFAQDNSQKLDSLFNSLYTYGQINGNVLVAENGVPLYQKSFGCSNFKTKALNNDNSGFSLASISKTFTSTAILQLKEKGKLKLDDLVTKYFSDFPYLDISIRHLLTHTSGLPSENKLFNQQIKDNPNKVFSNKDLLPTLKSLKLPLEFKPNDKFQYANTNYILLALLVEEISSLTFQEYVQKNIFSSAKMTNTYFQKDASQIGNKNRVIDYEYPFLYSTQRENVDSLEDYRVRMVNLSGFVGNGNIITTTTDIFKFDQALYAGKLVKQSSLQEAFTPNKLNNNQPSETRLGGEKASYGLGWFILVDSLKGKIVGHTGGVPGAMSILLRNLDKKQTVILFDNTFSLSLYKSGINAINVINNKSIVATKQSLTKIYGRTLAEKGIDVAFTKFQELRDDSLHYYFDENDMNDLGGQLLDATSLKGNKEKELALEVFKLNTLLFPSSANSYNSYAWALSIVGKTEQAIWLYKKSLTINPNDEDVKTELEKLLKNK
jgi:CubicO group peptidase (beta-lactamase class C family)